MAMRVALLVEGLGFPAPGGFLNPQQSTAKSISFPDR